MEKRLLGRTGHKSTLITLGGAALRPTGLSKNNLPTTRKESEAFINFALEHGVNHIDVSPRYGRGEAEVILGNWVREYRKNLFLACKTRKRTKIEAEEELRRSLKRLQTDYCDLYQLHGLDDPHELQIVLSDEGALRAILEAKKQGLVKYIGITSHNPENIVRALKAFDFDTVLLPVNYVVQAHHDPRTDYRPILALAKQRNLGVIAMKAAAKSPWLTEDRAYNCWYRPFDTQKEVDEALWFTLSQEVTTATHCSDIRIAKLMFDALERYTPLGDVEQQQLLKKATKYKPIFPRDF